MDRLKLTAGYHCKKSAALTSIILTALLSITTLPSKVSAQPAVAKVMSGRPPNASQQQIILNVVEDWIAVGTEQYKRGLYNASEQSFLQALEYQQSLPYLKRRQLNELLEKSRTAVTKRDITLKHIHTANTLLEQGKLTEAKAYLEKAKYNEYLTTEQQQQVIKGLTKLDARLNKEKRQTAELYERSVRLYRSGQLEKAREGFAKIAESDLITSPAGQTAEDYLVRIDSVLALKAQQRLSISDAEPDKQPAVSATDAEPVRNRAVTSKFEALRQKRNILRSYARAVVKDAVAKVRDHVKEGQFYKAKEAAEAATQALNEHQPYLEENLIRQYNSELKQLTEQIERGRTRWLGNE